MHIQVVEIKMMKLTRARVGSQVVSGSRSVREFKVVTLLFANMRA